MGKRGARTASLPRPHSAFASLMYCTNLGCVSRCPGAGAAIAHRCPATGAVHKAPNAHDPSAPGLPTTARETTSPGRRAFRAAGEQWHTPGDRMAYGTDHIEFLSIIQRAFFA